MSTDTADKSKWEQEFNSASRFKNYDDTISVISLRRDERLRVLQQLFPKLNDKSDSILELGAGTGIVTEMLADRYPLARIVAVDGSEGMIEVAKVKSNLLRGNSKVHWILNDLSFSNWKSSLSGQFELIVTVDALHHLEHFRKKELYAEILALLSPGGTFIISDHMTSVNDRNQDFQFDLWIEELQKNIRSLSHPGLYSLIDEELVKAAQLKESDGRADLKNRLTRMLNSEGENPLPVKQHIDWLDELGFSEVEVQYRFSSFSIITAKKA